MIVFLLGNHPALSLAEIYSCFPEAQIREFSEHFACVDGIEDAVLADVFPTIGWVLKAIKIDDTLKNQDDIANYLTSTFDGKITYGLNIYGKKENALSRALEIKKKLKAKWRSARCINKDPHNLSTASSLYGGIIAKGTEINIIHAKSWVFAGITTHIQDIESYTARDTGKSRSMTVGMLPPKLAQIMVNLSQAPKTHTIYDPFVGFGTVLLEWAHSGYTRLMGSDIKADLVETSKKNLQDFIQELRVRSEESSSDKKNVDNLEFGTWNLEFFEADATKLSQKKLDLTDTAIVTEWYLGKLFVPGNAFEKSIHEEKKNLIDLYDGFFRSLAKLEYAWTIIMTVPFWRLTGGKKLLHLTEFGDILSRHGFGVGKLLPEEHTHLLTPRKTLTYSRDDQVVGREIYKIQRI